MAATVPVDGENPLLEMAQQIGETGDTDTGTDPKTGSYEQFQAIFGDPRRWGS